MSSRLSPDQFARAEALFFEAGQLPRDRRDAFVAQACADDPTVAAEVQELLRHADTPLPPHLDSDAAPLAQGPALARRAADEAKALLGARVGAYEVTDVIGQGGMGVVYRAHDSRLGRGVAIKALPPALASDASAMSRFMREVRILASLTHPNVATVYDLADRNGHQYLIMELIEGPTLAQRLADGPLRIEEALDVCAQIADAVDAAHEAGVIHRDLKPHNVMLADGGPVKVLDFGLAREVGPRPADADADPHSATTRHHTREGAVMGTPGYMSPEQLRGQPVDRRTDVFALGCILYECLTGKVAFAGGTAADVTAAILEREPDWSALPPCTPQSIRRLLARCTAKDAHRRLRDMGDVRIELDDALAAREWVEGSGIRIQSGSAPTPPPAGTDSRLWNRATRQLIPAALVAVVFTAWVLWPKPARAPGPTAAAAASMPSADALSADAPLRRFAVKFPGNQPQTDLSRVRIAVARDGSKIVLSAAAQFAAEPGATTRSLIRTAITQAALGRPQLWVRDRDDLEFRPLHGTDNAFMPSFSHDAQWVIYHDDRTMTKKRVNATGNPVAITDAGGFWGTYFWGDDDVITYVPLWGQGVARISAQGGPPTFHTTVDYARGEFGHIGPCVTPDNRAALFTVWNGGEQCRIEAVEFATGKRHYNVVESGTTPRLARTPGGGHHLLYENNGNLFAAPFDVATLRRTGPGQVVVDGVMTDNVLFTAAYDVADDGTLAYVPGPVFVEESRLTWLDPKARATHDFGDDRFSFGQPVFTTDGKKLSVVAKGKTYGVHVYDIEKERFDRVVTDGDLVSAAISPDGKLLAYSSNKDGPYAIWVKDLQTNRARKLFDGPPSYQVQIAWSPDNRYVAYSSAPRVDLPRDIAYVDVHAPGGKPVSFVTGPFEKRAPAFSPDGKWLAYCSSQTGQREVFLRSFPDGQVSRQLTVGGGDWPAWSADGRTLYYRAKGDLKSLPVDLTTGTVTGRAANVYTKPFGQFDIELYDYAVDPATGRVLLIEPSDRGPKVTQVNVVLNWWRAMSDGRGR